MKKNVFILSILLLLIISINAKITIPDSVDKIKINLKSKTEINEALSILQKSTPKIYNKLIKLKAKDKDRFLKELHNHIYSWVNSQVLLKKRRKLKKNYRKQIKEIQKELNLLEEKYKTSSDQDKNTIKNQVKKLAVKRYQMELQNKQLELERAKAVYTKTEKELSRLQNNKDKFIKTVVHKCLKEK